MGVPEILSRTPANVDERCRFHFVALACKARRLKRLADFESAAKTLQRFRVPAPVWYDETMPPMRSRKIPDETPPCRKAGESDLFLRLCAERTRIGIDGEWGLPRSRQLYRGSRAPARRERKPSCELVEGHSHLLSWKARDRVRILFMS